MLFIRKLDRGRPGARRRCTDDQPHDDGRTMDVLVHAQQYRTEQHSRCERRTHRASGCIVRADARQHRTEGSAERSCADRAHGAAERKPGVRSNPAKGV